MLTVRKTITAAADAIYAGDSRTACSLLTPLLGDTDELTSPERRLARIFAESLLARIDGDANEGKNLYEGAGDERVTLSTCQDFTEADMLAAYQVLVDRTPLVRFGHAVANAALARGLANEANIHLIDIGIGRGGQWPSLLEDLASRPSRASCVRITGVELPGCGVDPEERLRLVGKKLTERAEALGVPFAFDSIAAQAQDVERFSVLPGEAVAVNAAFSLHHTPVSDAVTDASKSRDALLRRLLALRPRIFTLVEPDVEHNEGPLPHRVREAYSHYSAVFDLLGVMLRGEPRQRRILEEGFFGREILNVIGSEGVGRVERHERVEAWRRRLLESGFEPVDLAPVALGSLGALRLAPPLAAVLHRGVLELCWKGTPLFAVSAWRPAVRVSRSTRATPTELVSALSS